jgi:hypothetical protein
MNRNPASPLGSRHTTPLLGSAGYHTGQMPAAQNYLLMIVDMFSRHAAAGEIPREDPHVVL